MKHAPIRNRATHSTLGIGVEYALSGERSPGGGQLRPTWPGRTHVPTGAVLIRMDVLGIEPIDLFDVACSWAIRPAIRRAWIFP